MTHRIAITNNELKIIRYCLDQQRITLKNEIARLTDPRMNGEGDSLAKTFGFYVRDIANVLETLPEE